LERANIIGSEWKMESAKIFAGLRSAQHQLIGCGMRTMGGSLNHPVVAVLRLYPGSTGVEGCRGMTFSVLELTYHGTRQSLPSTTYHIATGASF
jgi:hypothetical protein